MRRRAFSAPRGLVDDPRWYKGAIIYELRVRSFMDSNGDGIGDFRGLTAKLDYLADLGINTLWLLPFYPSPLRDDGYDISDYTDVDPDVGTLDDFRTLLAEAHRRGLRVITELVLNHTSDQHPWFQRARRAPAGSPERAFYVWSDTPERYRDARIIFNDFEPSNWSWDPIAHQYYWHRFFQHQPDLNFENPEVRAALFGVVDFWLGLGVDGLRLDAVPYLYESEGTNCENLPETHAFLRELRRHVDERFANRMLLAEANQWPEDAAAYFGTRDAPECHMNFHFPIMPRIFMSIQMEDRLPLVDILQQTPELDESCQWAMFLRNHDELTLEMVTDEERDYMVRAYAAEPAMRLNLGIRRRLAPLLGNDRRKIELCNALLMSFPGSPILYYGDEIGMGDNVYLGDRNGVRTPMQWSADRNAGFSRANPHRLILPVNIDPEYHYEALNVEAQQANPNSLLWWTKRLVALRQRFGAFGRGSLELLSPDNPRILAFLRRHGDETLLIVANLSRSVQYAELDLSTAKGLVPVELLGGTRLPAIGDAPYLLTLGGYAFYWFQLERPAGAEAEAREAAYQPPLVTIDGGWESLFSDTGGNRETLAEIAATYLEERRWFRRALRLARVVDVLPVEELRIAILRVEYADGDADLYAQPLAFVADATELRARSPHALLAQLRFGDGGGWLYDPLADAPSSRPLVRAIAGGANGALRGHTLLAIDDAASEEPRLLPVERANAIVLYGNRWLLKLFRRLDEGVRPAVEIGRYLAERAQTGEPAPTPPLAGWLEWCPRRGSAITLATLHRFVPAETDGWSYAADELKRFFDRVLTQKRGAPPPEAPANWLELAAAPAPSEIAELIGVFIESARLLGERTAELHLALAGNSADPAFAPEPYSTLDVRSTYQAMRNATGATLRLLRQQLPDHPLAREVLAAEARIFRRFEGVRGRRLAAARTRRHGDYQLHSVLWTGRDFVVVDFDGKSGRPLSERRRKRSPLRDVAGMVRSLSQVAFATLNDPTVVREADRALARPWAWLWHAHAAAAFLRGYFQRCGDAPFLPRDPRDAAVLLDAFVLEKALKDVADALERHPAGAPATLEALLRLLQ